MRPKRIRKSSRVSSIALRSVSVLIEWGSMDDRIPGLAQGCDLRFEHPSPVFDQTAALGVEILCRSLPGVSGAGARARDLAEVISHVSYPRWSTANLVPT
jgi:hypothetical protein